MQTTNHISPPTIITNHTTPTSFSYHPLTLHANAKSQPDSLPNPLNNVQAIPFLPSTILAQSNWSWSNPPTYPHFPNTFIIFTQSLFPTCGHQFPIQRLTHHQYYCQRSNSYNPNPYEYPNSIPSLLPPHLKSFHLIFCCPRLYNYIPIAF